MHFCPSFYRRTRSFASSRDEGRTYQSKVRGYKPSSLLLTQETARNTPSSTSSDMVERKKGRGFSKLPARFDNTSHRSQDPCFQIKLLFSLGHGHDETSFPAWPQTNLRYHNQRFLPKHHFRNNNEHNHLISRAPIPSPLITHQPLIPPLS